MTVLAEAEAKLIQDGNEETAQTLESFESRWRYAVFPAMIAFVILAAFGFYLIYGILNRMEVISADITRMTNLMEQSIPAMSKDVNRIGDHISTSMPALEAHVGNMTANVTSMSQSATDMAHSTRNMGHSTWELNRSISKPMKVMNKMIPWSVSTPRPPAYRPY